MVAADVPVCPQWVPDHRGKAGGKNLTVDKGHSSAHSKRAGRMEGCRQSDG